MSEEKDIEIVKKILDCQERLSKAYKEQKNIENSNYEKEPDIPVRISDDKLAPPIPKLESNKKLAFGPFVVCDVIAIVGAIFRMSSVTDAMSLLIFLAVIWIPIYYIRLSKKRKQHTETVKNSFEYKMQWENAKRQEDERYKKAVKDYEETLRPQWETGYSQWLIDKTVNLARANSKVNSIGKELNELYASYPQIPEWCHNGVATQFLYKTMSESDCSLKYALDRYKDILDKERQEAERRAAERRRYEAEIEAWHQRKEEEGYSNQGGGFVRDVAAVGLGVAAGNKISGVGGKKDNSSSREKTAAYTCSPSCPRKGKGYGKSRCELNPNTCGYGLRYTDDTLLRSRR